LKVVTHQTHSGDRLLEKVWIRWDIWQGYHICRSKIPDSLNSYFRDNKQALYCSFSMFLQSTAKQHYYRYTCKIIV